MAISLCRRLAPSAARIVRTLGKRSACGASRVPWAKTLALKGAGRRAPAAHPRYLHGWTQN
ncbi:MAG: hypothetical protein DMF84_06670 [Acidobacteria bacterium]|nr:MAG: hypothetical protein DMF84_06670 [Acidobacteriota bacterium]